MVFREFNRNKYFMVILLITLLMIFLVFENERTEDKVNVATHLEAFLSSIGPAEGDKLSGELSKIRNEMVGALKDENILEYNEKSIKMDLQIWYSMTDINSHYHMLKDIDKPESFSDYFKDEAEDIVLEYGLKEIEANYLSDPLSHKRNYEYKSRLAETDTIDRQFVEDGFFISFYNILSLFLLPFFFILSIVSFIFFADKEEENRLIISKTNLGIKAKTIYRDINRNVLRFLFTTLILMVVLIIFIVGLSRGFDDSNYPFIFDKRMLTSLERNSTLYNTEITEKTILNIGLNTVKLPKTVSFSYIDYFGLPIYMVNLILIVYLCILIVFGINIGELIFLLCNKVLFRYTLVLGYGLLAYGIHTISGLKDGIFDILSYLNPTGVLDGFYKVRFTHLIVGLALGILLLNIVNDSLRKRRQEVF